MCAIQCGNPRRRGFTIIELLCVILVVAILASIAITKFGDSKRRAYIAAMKSDLRSIASMAEAQYTSDNSYANVAVPPGSDGVSLNFVGAIDSWNATATHAAVPGMTCTLGNGPGASSEPLCQ